MVQYDVKRVTKGAENFMVSFDFAKTPITQVADYIIIAAQKNKTSDIHFDPRDEGMMVRFRIDGDCQDYTFIPKAYERNLTTRLKLLANMNITETRLPQDGAIKGQFGDTYMDMRVACLPTNQGEKIVIRILDYTRSLQGIDSLGFHPKNLEKIHHMMGVPNGIILVTGATGSGKSTTTYSMLSALNKPEVNVITVEDPVEMNIEGINQVQVNAEIGMTFAAALRSILREDPNVILIGEIRDSETAQIAVRASITGHLVMSTLHTNNALATVERLLDMDVERYLLSTALTGIISQRLAKQLCPDCRFQREPTKYEKKVYKKFLHQDITQVWDANPKGCDNCRKGYKGRIAVHEVLLLDDKIRNALNDEKMSKDDFAKMIYSGNTISMLQDALIKSLEGQTSFEEVYKTIEIENEDEDNYAEELEGISINQTAATEEVHEEKTAEDEMGEDINHDANLTEKYIIPGVNSGSQPDEEQEKFPVEQPADEQVQVAEEVPAEQSVEEQVQVTEEVPTEQPTEEQAQVTEEVPTEQPTDEQVPVAEEVPAEQPTDEQVPVAEEAPVEQTVKEQVPIAEEAPVEQTVEEQVPVAEEAPVEQTVEEQVQEEPADYFSVTTDETAPVQIPQTEVEETPIEDDTVIEDYFSVTTDGQPIEQQIPAEDNTNEEENYSEQPEDYFSAGPNEQQPENTISNLQSLSEENIEATENAFEMPQVSETPIADQQEQPVEETVETTENQFEMPQVSETPIAEQQERPIEEIVETTENQFEMPQVSETPVEENTNEYNEEQVQDNNLGYTIAMPEDYHQEDTTPTEENELQSLEHNSENEIVEETETTETEFEMPQVEEQATIDEQEEQENPLDSIMEEVTDEDDDEEPEDDEEEHEKYTVSATRRNKKAEDVEESDDEDNALAPIIDPDEESEEDDEEEQEQPQYQHSNSIYYEEEAIDPTIDIKTDLDELITSNTTLEKLDNSLEEDETPEENEEVDQIETHDEEVTTEQNESAAEETTEDTQVKLPSVEQSENSSEETNKYTQVELPSVEQTENSAEETTEYTQVELPSVEQTENSSEETTEYTQVELPSVEQSENSSEETTEYTQVELPSVEQTENSSEETTEYTQVELPSVEQSENSSEETTEYTQIELPSVEQSENNSEETTEYTQVELPSVEQTENSSEETTEYTQVELPSVEQSESEVEETPEEVTTGEIELPQVNQPQPENNSSQEDDDDDYEYDYEYDDYDFENEENDYTAEEQEFFNQTYEFTPPEGHVPNIQAVSAVPDVADITTNEEHTGSNILADPGIRIADDGSINQSAEINADPILPNYEDE